ncbi:hypothetical protein Tco_0282501 [Tanacetum coccineum]
MSNLKFAKTHNLIAFLEKPKESAGFEKVVDFLSANPINYALTLNPTLYTSCIEQFWATTKVKIVNGEKQLQALVDKKKVIITETSIRRDLNLEDANGIDCLPNATIFAELARMGYEKHSQKLTFYKAFFTPQWKFLIHTILQCLSAKTTAWNEFNNENKFLMYPIFVQVFLDKQVGDMSTHDDIYVTPSHTKKVFANMKREGKDFSRRVTPLFPTMMEQAQEDMGKGSASSVPTGDVVDEAVCKEWDDRLVRAATTASSLGAEQDNGNIIKTQSKTRPERVSKQSNDLPLSRVNTLRSGEDRLKLRELMELSTKLHERVIDLENSKTTQALVESSEDKGLGDQEDASKQWRKIVDIDDDAEITLVDETQGRNNDDDMFDINDLEGDEVIVESDVVTKKKDDEVNVVKGVSTAGDDVSVSAATITHVELTLAQTLVEIKTSKPNAKGITFKESSESATTTMPTIPIPSKDKGKGKMEEIEKPIKKKEQIRLDEELARKL